MHVRVFKPARAALPLAVYDDHFHAATMADQAATFYYPYAQSGRRQVDARSAERPAASTSLGTA